MASKRLTAVEWLLHELIEMDVMNDKIHKKINEAKKKEEVQILLAYYDGAEATVLDADEYYHDNYK